MIALVTATVMVTLTMATATVIVTTDMAIITMATATVTTGMGTITTVTAIVITMRMATVTTVTAIATTATTRDAAIGDGRCQVRPFLLKFDDTGICVWCNFKDLANLNYLAEGEKCSLFA
jgi:hypothetical protein